MVAKSWESMYFYLKEQLLGVEEICRKQHSELKLLREIIERECDETVLLEYIKAKAKIDSY